MMREYGMLPRAIAIALLVSPMTASLVAAHSWEVNGDDLHPDVGSVVGLAVVAGVAGRAVWLPHRRSAIARRSLR